MSRAYSADLRERVLAAVAAGQSARGAAARFGIGPATASRWVRRWRETGERTARKLGRVHTISGYTHRMELTDQQYEQIKELLPRQRGNVKVDNRRVLSAILYIVEHGCKWRGLPEHFGKWHTIYMRMNRWAKNGVLERVFAALQQQQIIRVRVEAVSLDSTVVQVHPDGTGARKKTDRKPSASPGAAGRPSFIWLPRMLAPP